jgi:hypothetical protein
MAFGFWLLAIGYLGGWRKDEREDGGGFEAKVYDSGYQSNVPVKKSKIANR